MMMMMRVPVRLSHNNTKQTAIFFTSSFFISLLCNREIFSFLSASVVDSTKRKKKTHWVIVMKLLSQRLLRRMKERKRNLSAINNQRRFAPVNLIRTLASIKCSHLRRHFAFYSWLWRVRLASQNTNLHFVFYKRRNFLWSQIAGRARSTQDHNEKHISPLAFGDRKTSTTTCTAAAQRKFPTRHSEGRSDCLLSNPTSAHRPSAASEMLLDILIMHARRRRSEKFRKS